MMMPPKFNLVPLLALIFAGHVDLHSVDIHPERTTGIEGGEVQISCEVEFGPNLQMTWDFNNDFVYIIARGEDSYPLGTSKYSVYRAGMNFTLIIKNLRLEDGGEYMCTSFTSEATAFLVVLDTPSITLNPPALIEGQTTKVTCEARFGGPSEDLILPGHFPNLTMYLKGSTQNEMLTAKATYDVKEYSIISMTTNLTVDANMDKSHITCEIGTAEPSMKTSNVAVLNVFLDPSKSGNEEENEDFKSNSSTITIAVLIVIILILVIIAAVTFIFRKKLYRRFKRSSTNENPRNIQELGSVEAENLLTENIPEVGSLEAEISEPDIQEGKRDNGASKLSVTAKNTLEDGSADAEIALPDIQEGKGDAGESIHSLGDQEPEELKQRSLDCINKLHMALTEKELNEHGEEILKILQEDGEKILRELQENGKSICENYPNILNELISKACQLIDSEYYEDIIEVVAHGSEDSPLRHLLQLMNGEVNLKKLLKNENKLLSVIKIISKYGDIQYRTECLTFLIFPSKNDNSLHFQWSKELLSALKDLLDKGADPTWIPQGIKEQKRELRSTAQTIFFWNISLILWEKNELHDSILQVLPLMLSKKCTNNEFLRGTLLHAFVEPHWDFIATNIERMPPNFFHQFKFILSEILRRDETLILKQDFFGRTPLLVFLNQIQLNESIFSDVREIIQQLQSPKVLTVTDSKGENALHYIAMTFPVLQELASEDGLESLLELFISFANRLNVCSQNNNGNSVLHILARKFPNAISQQSGVAYQNIIKHLATYQKLDMEDCKGLTALHILAYQFTLDIPNYCMETFLEVMKCLAVPCSICIRGPNGQTAFEIISQKIEKKVPKEYQSKTTQILDLLNCNVTKERRGLKFWKK